MKKNLKKNMKNAIKKINIQPLLKIGKNDCKPFIDKEGEIIRSSKKIDRNYKNLICIMKGKIKFTDINFPYLYGNENLILKKLLIIKKAQEENLKYFYKPIRNTINKDDYPDNSIFVFYDENLEKALYMEFLPYIKNIDELFYREFYPKDETKEENLIKYFATLGMKYKLSFLKISDEELLSLLFYHKYIFFIQKELIKKYGHSLKDFQNYHQLYLYLKSKGYIKLFFNKYGPKIIKLIPDYIKKIKNHSMFNIFVEDIRKKEVKNFKDLSIFDLIDEYVPDYIDKKILWQNYNNLIKKIKI